MQVSLQEKQKVNIKLYKAVPCCFLFIACITGIIFVLFYNMLINDEHINFRSYIDTVQDNSSYCQFYIKEELLSFIRENLSSFSLGYLYWALDIMRM